MQKTVIDFSTVNNLGEELSDETFDGADTSVGSDVAGVPAAPSDSAALRAETTDTPDALGDDSQTQTMDVDQETGEILDTDTTSDTYDASGDPVASDDSSTDDSGGTTLDGDAPSCDTQQTVTHTTTDDAGRVTAQWTTLNSTGATISATNTQFDGDGNAIFVTSSVLQPDGTMRVSYAGNWYDADGNVTTNVNYGTNGGTAMSARPDSPPSRSTTPGSPEVTSYTYTPEGYVDKTTDPRGIVTKEDYDEQGNVTETISNFQGDGTPDADEPDVNQTTDLTYNSDNEVVDQTAVNPGGVNQTTENVYGPSGPDADNSLLLAVEYPDPATGEPSTAQEVTYTYNSAGQKATMTDRDGTVHTYDYDDDGNQIADVITTLGAGVDGTVAQRDTDYNDEGQPTDFTTKNAAGTILSQVEETYDGNGNVIDEAQSHDGDVTDDTPSVGYGFQETAGGQARQTSLTYPDGREIDFGYGSPGSMTDAEGLVASISDANSFDNHILATYTYLGDGTVVGQSRPQTGANGSITLDNFGNVADLNWTNGAGTSTDHFGFGYDADGNVLYKQNYVLPTDSELYHANGAAPGYDGLNRLTTFARGTLSASISGGTLDTVSSASTTQSWALDALGNQTAVTTNGVTQSKTQNAQNQTTSVTTSGTTNALSYDPNGATTTDEQGRHWTYDAWGDPVSVTNASGTLIETDGFDALGRRITVTTYASGSPETTDLYYSIAGQVIEEDRGGSVVSQTVYGTTYVNDVIEVDQATSTRGTLDQRIYFQQDANHNVTSITDASGTVLERYVYDPYGNITVLNPDGTVKGDGTLASSSYNLPNLYQGMLYDAATGDYMTSNRLYDPMLGTWTSEDPDGTVNGDDLYQAEVGNPTLFTDPSGTEIRVRGNESIDGVLNKSGLEGHYKTPPSKGDDKHYGVVGDQLVETGGPYLDYNIKPGDSLKLSGDLTQEILYNMMLTTHLLEFASPADLERHVAARIQAVRATRVQFGLGWVDGSGDPNAISATGLPAPTGGHPTSAPTDQDQFGAIGAMYGASATRPAYSFPCGYGSAYAVLAGAAAKDSGVDQGAFNKLAAGDAFGNFAKLSDSRQADGVWIPGDRLHIANTKAGAPVLQQGEFLIYVGSGKFWGHLGSDLVQTLPDWLKTVGRWGPPAMDGAVQATNVGLTNGLK